MFEVPEGSGNVREGTSEEHPIVLDEDLEEFRSLLWALHLLPNQVAALINGAPAKETCMQLLQVASLAHKYLFEDLDRWALETVHAFMEKLPFNLCQQFLLKFLRVTLMCEPDALHTSEDLVRQALEASKVDLVDVITVAETLGLDGLAGEAYHRMLVGGTWLKDPALTYAQRTNLLYGYHVFTELWISIRRAQPVISHHACTHLGPCLWMWGEIWKEVIISAELLAISPVDVIGKLNAIKASNAFLKDRSGLWPDKGGLLAFACRTGAERVIDERIADIEENLYSYFVPHSSTQS